MSEHVDDVDITHNEDVYLDCPEVGTELKWSFHIKTEVGNLLFIVIPQQQNNKYVWCVNLFGL